MPISQQVLKRIKINQLKGLRDLEIDFQGKQLTAIMGQNGVGKSTILHAIACINNPVAGPPPSVNHKLSEFFTPTTHSTWTGSSFDVVQDYRDGANVYPNILTSFRKQQNRWAPRYVTRIPRYISFIGVRTCVPIIETETQQSRIRFNTTALTDAISNQVKRYAGHVMNRNYTDYYSHRTPSNKSYIGVTTGAFNYSSLTMGAGEQRIFYILSEIIKAPNHGLILIDEIDLLLHQDALLRLLEVINRLATAKNVQVIFTTHAHSILNLNFINFKHLYQTPLKTLCFNQTKPDALHRLTGQMQRPLEIFVEDDLAYYLIKKISAEEGISKYVSITPYGAAINCFTTVGGAILKNVDNLGNMLFVLDGDEYSTDAEKIDKIGRVLTGNTPAYDAKRELAFTKITQFVIPDGVGPERYYSTLICDLPDGVLSPEQLEIVRVARGIVNPDNTHKFIDEIITSMDFNREVGLSKIIDIISLSDHWADVKVNIRNWLLGKRDDVVE